MLRVISSDSSLRCAGADAVFTVVERLRLLYTRNIIAIGAFFDFLTALISICDDLLFSSFRHSMFDGNTKFLFSLFRRMSTHDSKYELCSF